MQKQYVTLEIESENDIGTFPFGELHLGENEKISNFRVLTVGLIAEQALAYACGEVFSDTGDFTSEQIVEELNRQYDEDNEGYFEHDDITVYHLYEDYPISSLIDVVEEISTSYVYSVGALLQLDGA